MTDLVTLAEAKAHLRVDHTAEDDLIAIYIAAASEAVLATADGYDPEDPVPDRLKLAVLARVAINFDERESVAAGTGEDRLVSPLRNLDT